MVLSLHYIYTRSLGDCLQAISAHAPHMYLQDGKQTSNHLTQKEQKTYGNNNRNHRRRRARPHMGSESLQQHGKNAQ